MKLKTALIISLIIVPLTASTSFSQKTNGEIFTGSGTVVSVSPGSLYIGGVPHNILTLRVGNNTELVVIPSFGPTMQPISPGETVIFSGPKVTVGTDAIVNTQEGYIYRAAEMSMAQYQAKMMEKAQKEMDKQAKSGIPNAVPILQLQTPAQATESAFSRRTDLILASLAILVGLLALDRVWRMLVVPITWVRSRFKKHDV